MLFVIILFVIKVFKGERVIKIKAIGSKSMALVFIKY